MAIALPTCPLPNVMTPMLRDFGGILSPFKGGPEQRINRIGTRFAVRYQMPEMDGEDARAFVARLLRASQSTALMPWPITDFDPGTPGTPSISTPASGGSAIAVKDLMAGYTVSEGQFFSVIHGGRRYVHMSTGDVTANGVGAAVLSIFPPLRTALSTNDPVEMAAPMIEGSVSPGDNISWEVALELDTAISFIISETK